MSKKIVTQEDLDANPELVEKGVKVGEEIDIPDSENLNTEPIEDEDTGGSVPPPNKERG